MAAEVERLADISAWLRREREVSFYGDIYGDIDLIPTDLYDISHAQRALDDARFVVEVAGRLIPSP